MNVELYSEYKKDTGKEPSIGYHLEEHEILGRYFYEISDLEPISDPKNEDEYYTIEYIHWLESKLEEARNV